MKKIISPFLAALLALSVIMLSASASSDGSPEATEEVSEAVNTEVTETAEEPAEAAEGLPAETGTDETEVAETAELPAEAAEGLPAKAQVVFGAEPNQLAKEISISDAIALFFKYYTADGKPLLPGVPEVIVTGYPIEWVAARIGLALYSDMEGLCQYSGALNFRFIGMSKALLSAEFGDSIDYSEYTVLTDELAKQLTLRTGVMLGGTALMNVYDVSENLYITNNLEALAEFF